MTRKRKVEFVARLRRHEEFEFAEPWHLNWLRSMDASEQREIADDLNDYDMESALMWWARNQFFLCCPDSIVKFRAIFWKWSSDGPTLSYIRQLAVGSSHQAWNFDDSSLFEYDPYIASNDNPNIKRGARLH